MSSGATSVRHGIAGPVLTMEAEKWRAAYRIALANAGIFLCLALVMFVLEPRALAVILSVPVLFFLGCMASFLLMVRSSGELAAVAWFVFGAGLYFGLGAMAGGLHVHPHSDYLFANDTRYLLQANLLNASSVFIVLVAAYPFTTVWGAKADRYSLSQPEMQRILQAAFPYVVGISVAGVVLKYILFPVAENLLVRGVASKIYLIIPSCFLLLGLLWESTSRPLQLAASGVLILEVFNGLLAFSKYQIMSAMLAVVIGVWLQRRSVRVVLMTLMILAVAFVVISPITTLGRTHHNYDAGTNTMASRLAILADIGKTYLGVTREGHANSDAKMFVINQGDISTIEGRLKALGRRFDVISVQGFLINEYNAGRPGRSMVDFWAVMIPRIVWPEKPVVTRFGGELNARFYYHPIQVSDQTGSSTAPTYSGEAYWNYGLVGVVVVSVLLGLGIGWFTRCWQVARAGLDPGYFGIAFPVAIWACYVESWVVGTFFGEFIIFIAILFGARACVGLLGTKFMQRFHEACFRKNGTVSL